MEEGFAFIEMVEEFVYMEDDFCDMITHWARKHCSTFVDKDPKSVEQPLEHTQLHEEYSQLFESILEGFLRDKDMSVQEFYSALADQYALAEERQSDLPVNATFAATLLSFTDFFSFCELMYDVNNGREAIFCPPLLEIPADGTGGGARGGAYGVGDSDSKDTLSRVEATDYKSDYKNSDAKADAK
mgnify:CR=1 FL=1